MAKFRVLTIGSVFVLALSAVTVLGQVSGIDLGSGRGPALARGGVEDNPLKNLNEDPNEDSRLARGGVEDNPLKNLNEDARLARGGEDLPGHHNGLDDGPDDEFVG